jgi:hypothetical protein
MESRWIDNGTKSQRIITTLDFTKSHLMINKKEMGKMILQAGHTPINGKSAKGKPGTRITGSIFRECKTTITRV